MYESPKLVRFGQFRELTQEVCLRQYPWTGKMNDTYDPMFPKGTNDGCARS